MLQYQAKHQEARAYGLPIFVSLDMSKRASLAEEDFEKYCDGRLIEAVKPVCHDECTMGGGFGVRHAKRRPPPLGGGSGMKREICCSGGDSFKPKAKCPWQVFYELTHEGWVLYSFQKEHNSHPLSQSKAEVMARSSGRMIPRELEELGAVLHEAGFSASDINRAFQTKLRMGGIHEPTFIYQDVYNKYKRTSPATRLMDASNLLAMLTKRKQELELQYYVDSDDSCRIDKWWAECSGAQRVWGTNRTSYILSNVLSFDPTFGTNRYGC